MRRSTARLGLSLVETLLAITVLGVVVTAVSATMVGSVKQNTVSGQRTQAVQVLNFVGRRVTGGDTAVIPAEGQTLAWDYGQLAAAFPSLEREGGFADPALYRAEVTNRGPVAFGGGEAHQYDLRACFRRDGAEHCLDAQTFGPSLQPGGGGTPALPGIS